MIEKESECTLNLLDLLFPVKCPVCGELLSKKGERICQSCRKELPYVTEPCCMRCGKPLEKATREYCQDCGKKRYSDKKDFLCQGTALWVYTDRMKRAMADFKYNGCYRDGVFFAGELVRFRGGKIRKWHADYIIPVPLHRRKIWFRGYNQAACVAEELGSQIGIPVMAALERLRSTKPQKDFDDKGRRDNVKGAFSVSEQCRKMLYGKCILLVDDIYTTGATLEACAKALTEAGVKKVYFACLCIGRDY